MSLLKKLVFTGFLITVFLLPSLTPTLGALISPSPTLDQIPEEPAPTNATSLPTEENLEPIPVEPPVTVETQVPISQPFNSKATKLNLSAISEDLSKAADKSGDFSVSILKSKLKTAKSNLSSLKTELAEKNIPANILSRIDTFENNYIEKVSEIIQKSEAGENIEDEVKNFLQKPEVKIENPTPFRATVFDGQIKKANVSDFPKTNLQTEGDLIKNLITSAVLKTQSILDVDNSEVPNSELETHLTSNTQLQTSNASSPADLEESEEIQFTENLKNLAISLENDPLTIFNYVANNIDYVPYYGSKKGADSTLLEKLGNDFDQTSLLIGLLRVGDTNGQNKTPSRYKQATIKLSVGEVMDLLGVEDPIVAATVFEKTGVPYILYVDQNQTPIFFVVEITYAEAYIDYDYTRGVIQGNPGAQKRWIPLAPFLAKFYKSQHLNALDEMNFNVETFFENYLIGNYGDQKPIEALKGDIQTYLTSVDPDFSLEDASVQTYRSEEDLEFLPLTLPFEVVSNLNGFNFAPDNLKHKIEFQIVSEDGQQEILTYSGNVPSLANKEIILDYNPATSEDGQIINSFPTIYDVVPLSLVNVRPVVKVNGNVVGIDLSVSSSLGQTNKLKIVFKSPKKDIGSTVSEKIIDTVEKSTIAGNIEAIAINSDRVAPPEIRPSADTETSSAVASQKLWKTAENFLYRLQTSHDELARLTGGRFTNAATRAVVFNGLDVEYQSGAPYAFDWKGLRIDASSVVNYYSHFSQDPERHQKEFMYLFGLQASLDEADIFENDFEIESISTTKGLKLINQNQIPGVLVKKITSANESEINSLSISESTKNKLKDAVHMGHVVYVPNSQFTYESWTGLVYIDIDPATGFGSYIIGEGLNGGYTACSLPGQGAKSGQQVCVWNEGLVNFLRGINLLGPLSANIILPTQNQQFTKGSIIHTQINYGGQLAGFLNLSWTEKESIDTSNWDVGPHPIQSKYDTNLSVTINIGTDCLIGNENCDYDNFIFQIANHYGIPPGILKAIIHKETQIDSDRLFNPKTSRYEPFRDFIDFSGPNPTRSITSVPYSFFSLPGMNSSGQTISKGPKVDTLPRDYRSTLKNTGEGGWQLRGIINKDGNGDGVVTVIDLYINDRNIGDGKSQGWPATSTIPSTNFTPQFLLSSSYGLGHVMYLEATNAVDPQSNKIMKSIDTPHSIVDNPALGIELSASILKGKFSGPVAGDNCDGWSAAVRAYNGVGERAERYKKEVCDLYTSKYK